MSCKPPACLKHLHIIQAKQHSSSNKNEWDISAGSKSLDIPGVQISDLDPPRILNLGLRVSFLPSQGPDLGIGNFLGLRMQYFFEILLLLRLGPKLMRTSLNA